jgi:hypothetical protein
LLGFVGQQWEQHIVAELDSALNKWIDSVPDHRTQLSTLLSDILSFYLIDDFPEQSGGIQTGKTTYSLANLWRSTPAITTCKY